MKRYDEDFKSKLIGLEFSTLENSPNIIFGLSNDLKIIYFNPAWLKFAKSNGGEPTISERFPIGTSIELAMTGTIKDFYISNYKKVFQDLKVWRHTFECSSPSLYRLFYQEVFPLKNGEGIIIINSLRNEQLIDESVTPTSTSSIDEYINVDGMITQCSNCRKIQRVDNKDVWDWVPSLVTEVHPLASHSICPICYDYYWKYKNK